MEKITEFNLKGVGVEFFESMSITAMMDFFAKMSMSQKRVQKNMDDLTDI